MAVTDVHTHAFPDAIVERAMERLLSEAPGVEAFLDGRLSSLLASMDASGIERSVLLCIATRPEQFDKIMAWCREIRSERIEPFPSVHPDDPDAALRIGRIADEGFKGIKLHPYYQKFSLDEERVFPIYEALAARGLILLSHTGFDIAFPRERIADPARIARVLDAFPDLTFVASHFGSWQDWDEVEARLLGRPVYMELSWSQECLGLDRTRSMLRRHPSEYILFGSDSPWRDQAESLAALRALGMGEAWETLVLEENPARLLGLGRGELRTSGGV